MLDILLFKKSSHSMLAMVSMWLYYIVMMSKNHLNLHFWHQLGYIDQEIERFKHLLLISFWMCQLWIWHICWILNLAKIYIMLLHFKFLLIFFVKLILILNKINLHRIHYLTYMINLNLFQLIHNLLLLFRLITN